MEWFWLSLVIFAATVSSLVSMTFGVRRVRQLADIPPLAGATAPRVSIVVSALDEEATIEPGLRSLLALDYPDLEVVAIDDRSTDGTGAILDRLAATDPRLRVLHIRELPAGWLGKNNALQQGAGMATGEYLLFTDADVLFEPQALRRAVNHCQQERLDHLVVMPEFTASTPLLAALLITVWWFMFRMHAPWKVRRSKYTYIGMGAFNLVRAASYRQAGGHIPLRMEVIDDVRLGQVMKAHGFVQDALFGGASVVVEWYPDVRALVRGLEKNSFASVHYSLPLLVVLSLAMLVGHCWPLIGLFVTSGRVWWMNAGSVAAIALLNVVLWRTTRYPAHCLWWWPLTPLMMLGVMWRGVVLTLAQGGVRWRGTFYPLAELKRGRRPVVVPEVPAQQ